MSCKKPSSIRSSQENLALFAIENDFTEETLHRNRGPIRSSVVKKKSEVTSGVTVNQIRRIRLSRIFAWLDTVFVGPFYAKSSIISTPNTIFARINFLSAIESNICVYEFTIPSLCFVYTGTFSPNIFCVDPTYFICVCKCTAHFLRRAFSLAHFASGKAGMSTFRHLRRDAENASKSVHLHWQFFCVAGNAQYNCASGDEALWNKNSFSIYFFIDLLAGYDLALTDWSEPLPRSSSVRICSLTPTFRYEKILILHIASTTSFSQNAWISASKKKTANWVSTPQVPLIQQQPQKSPTPFVGLPIQCVFELDCALKRISDGVRRAATQWYATPHQVVPDLFPLLRTGGTRRHRIASRSLHLIHPFHKLTPVRFAASTSVRLAQSANTP